MENKTTDQALAGINRDLQEKAARQHAKDLNLPYLDIAGFPVNPDILHLVPLEEAKTASLMPFFKTGKKLKIAVTDPDRPQTQATMKQLTDRGFSLETHLVSEAGFSQALKLYASDQYQFTQPIKNVVKDEEIRYEKELENISALAPKLAALPAEEGLNTLHVAAIRAGASDIHYQPEEAKCAVRFRIDGVLHPAFSISREVYMRLAQQLKYNAKMQLNVTNVPQDGRLRFTLNDRKIDVRVASLPTEYGEAFVCRILDSAKQFASFEDLGFSGRPFELLNSAARLARGMVLVTGPTSSGKTTTLYVLLGRFNKPEVKIITLEDPIEYHLSGITQSQVDEKEGYSFGSGLRSILRQNPDVVMIGEIRDRETAQVAASAALTGHVVLSTLHTNSAVETIPRLLASGVPAFMVAPALSVVVAQRLVRRLCAACGLERDATVEEKAFLEKMAAEIKKTDSARDLKIPEKLKRAKGCEACSGTGFRGQMVIAEALHVDDDIEAAILSNASAPDIFALARKKGMLTMAEDGLLKVLEGKTTLEEVQRVANA